VGGWLTSLLDRFTPGNDPRPIVKEAGWAVGPVWTGAENLSRTGIRFPDPQAVTSCYADCLSGLLFDYPEHNLVSVKEMEQQWSKCR
jgi:hypothetical protein